jgi:hypothetical protein
MPGVKAPKITLTCDCGVARRVDYGERYTCTCGRSWSTDGIPATDYEQIRRLDLRYRQAGWAAGAFLGGAVLFVILTNPVALMFSVPGTMMVWFAFRPMIRRRHWRRVQALTRSWNLKPERKA